jgi:hypothetical protein
VMAVSVFSRSRIEGQPVEPRHHQHVACTKGGSRPAFKIRTSMAQPKVAANAYGFPLTPATVRRKIETAL